MSASNNTLLPTKVRLEACTLCQLDCKACFMRKWNYCGLGANYLKYDDFVRFLKLNPSITAVELSNNGEFFLNPDLSGIMEYAAANKVTLTAWGGANFNTVSPEVLGNLVKYNFEGITVSIDGWDQESYVQYRRGGDFDTVINNLRLLKEFKNKYNSWRPHLIWKYIIFEHNDNADGAEKAKQLAKELGMDFIFSKDWEGYEPKNIKSEMPEKSVFSGWNTPCSQLWLDPQINWDGRFLGCCVNDSHIYGDGNLFEIPLLDYLESPAIKGTKQMLMGGKFACGTNPTCEKCSFYKAMQRDNRFISEQELLIGGRLVLGV